MHTLAVIDSHSAGEPTRVVVAGFPDLGNFPLDVCRDRFRDTFDHWRSAIACEPRGSDTMVGALLLPAHARDACGGVIFFNNVGYLGMCGHGTMGVIRTLHHLGRIMPGQHRLETPVGTVGIELADDGQIWIDNVEAYRYRKDVSVRVDGHGDVTGDIAWGGNWFFITSQTPVALTLEHQRVLTAYTEAIRHALEREGITGENGGVIDHIEVNAAGVAPVTHGRNFVLCPGLAYDRSPCGTGTSAKLACLAADGALAPGVLWRQEGLLGTVFEASYQPGERGILPRIGGYAYITAQTQLLIDDADPFAWGIDVQSAKVDRLADE